MSETKPFPEDPPVRYDWEPLGFDELEGAHRDMLDHLAAGARKFHAGNTTMVLYGADESQIRCVVSFAYMGEMMMGTVSKWDDDSFDVSWYRASAPMGKPPTSLDEIDMFEMPDQREAGREAVSEAP